MSGFKHEVVEANSLKMEDGAMELMHAPVMEPYLRYIEAAVQGGDIDAALREIAQLPLEARYVWRIASALKWAFADFDAWSVTADRKTLAPGDARTIARLLKIRPLQFCLFMKALVGIEETEHAMNLAMALARES